MKLDHLIYILSPGDLIISGKNIYFQISKHTDMSIFQNQFLIRCNTHNTMMQRDYTSIVYDSDK